MRSNKRWIAAAVAMGVGLGVTARVEAGGGLFSKSSTHADHSGHAHHNHAPHDAVHQVSADGQIAEGTVISVTPIYPPGEEPGKASFDGTRNDARGGYAGGMHQPGHDSGGPSPIGVVQTNYNLGASNPAPRLPGPVDVMAHGKSAGGQAGMMPPGMMPPGMMAPGMMPPGQTPGLGMKPPRRGLFSRLMPGRSSASDPYAVFKMSKSQRAMHAATPLGPQAQGPVTSLPPSAVYGNQGGHAGH